MEVKINLDEMDLTVESRTTYKEIKVYVKEKVGQVSNLYIT